MKRAGGEYTVGAGSATLFPDVLLFGDSVGGQVLQGWELKLPDTPITEGALLSNARTKAQLLSLNSFLVWNAAEAVMYARGDRGDFVPTHSWPRIALVRRDDVQNGRDLWTSLLHRILDDLNDFFDTGRLRTSGVPKFLRENFFAEFANRYGPGYARKLRAEFRRSASLQAEADLWWTANSGEFPQYGAMEALARVNILNWLNKFFFAHTLKAFQSAAFKVDAVRAGTPVTQAEKIFGEITTLCDFMAVFQSAPGQRQVNAETWNGIVAFHRLLGDFHLERLSQSILREAMEAGVQRLRKKLAGQFTTPEPLAELLTRIALEDRTAHAIDPCCGTGTIARAIFDLKKEVGLRPSEAAETTWASDKFFLPLQLCTMALADPANMGRVLHVSRTDAFDLKPGATIRLVDPNGGGQVEVRLPRMSAVISNLPFVRFEDVAKLNPSAQRFAQSMTTRRTDNGDRLDTKSDLFAYLLSHFWTLLDTGGRLGAVVPNSFLGANWARRFRTILLRRFKIHAVVASAAGRWFANSDVVTNLLLLEKRDVIGGPRADEPINFFWTLERLEDWARGSGGVNGLAQRILASASSAPIQADRLAGQTLTVGATSELERRGVGWSAFFTDLRFVERLKGLLVPAHRLFEINRGERRGWDPLFYPAPGHGIEPEYLRSVVKTTRTAAGLVLRPTGKAFCCTLPLEELRRQGRRGVLRWIGRFARATNEKGRPLPEALHRSGSFWYEMKPATLADFALSVNPDKRLNVYRLAKRAFVNQRLISFSSRAGRNPDHGLCHALLNSVVGMFLIEAAGFGRGLGVLDLNATKLAQSLHMLDPARFSIASAANVRECFDPLLRRPPLDLPDELTATDRIQFDTAVLAAIGMADLRDQIYRSLISLYDVRQTARSRPRAESLPDAGVEREATEERGF